jgi:uncharacterized protein YdiU (UPF0061 family)
VREGDDDLTQDLLRLMAEHKADFTLSFRRLADAATGNNAALLAMFGDGSGFDAWAERWHARLAGQDPAAVQASLRAINPVFIPRNHLVEAALKAAVEEADFGPFEALLAVVSRPFDDDPAMERFTLPAGEDEKVLRTFCGT